MPVQADQSSDAGIELDLLAQLKEKNLAARGVMVLEGRIAIEKALDAGILPRFLVCTEAEKEYWETRAEGERTANSVAGGAMVPDGGKRLSGENDVAPPDRGVGALRFPVRALPHDELCALVDFKFHRGALAVADLPEILPASLDAGTERGVGQSGQAVCPASVEKTAPHTQFPFYLCLWDVTDPSNLGALVRSAAGLGVDGVLLGPGCANPYYRKTIRASMGNVFSLPLLSVDIAALATLGESGVRLCAAALGDNSVSLTEMRSGAMAAPTGPLTELEVDTIPVSAPLILILGNEGYGLPDEVLDLCSLKVRIPMARGVDSLNVAVAGGILMYELKTSPKNAVRKFLYRKE